MLRFLGALTGASRQPSKTPTKDFFEALKEAEEKVEKEFPEARPSGDGVEYQDRIMEIVIRRIRWQALITNGKELLGLLTVFCALAICLAFAWAHFVR
ncbi:MAG TPA: hypothetical protein VFP21_04890 [Solirubrobacterales bacterium]|nr:hypothetical protein [Solirubrobacterales bacterium]